MAASWFVILLMGIGSLQIVEPCNTNTETCQQLYYDAILKDTKEEQCDGMKVYLECIQQSIADCTDGSNDTEAQQAVNTFCGLVCLSQLSACQHPLTLYHSGLGMEEYCRLYEQVFTCLDDNITAACKEHEQVKPSITQLHEGSESICNPSSLCLTKVYACQTPLTAVTSNATDQYCSAYQQMITCFEANITATCKEDEQVKTLIEQTQQTVDSLCDPSTSCQMALYACQAPLTAGNSTQSSWSHCEDKDTDGFQDYCSMYQGMLSCVEKNMTAECQASEPTASQIHSIRQTVEQLCGTNSICSRDLAKCFCPMSNDSMDGLCTMIEHSASCMNRLPDRCSLSTEFAPTVESYHHMFPLYRYLYCDPNGGVCPAAVQCLSHLDPNSAQDEDDHTPSSTTTQPLHSDDVTSAGGPPESSYESSVQTAQTFSIPSPPIPKLDIEQFCTASAMFDCLTDVSSTCSIDQGNVTFAQVKQAAADMCQSFFPYWQTLAACGSLMECVANANNLTLLESVTNTSHQPSNEEEMGVVRLLAGATRTGFWCSFMDHVYGCAMDSATRCSLQDHLMMMVRGKKAALANTCQGAATAAPPSQDTNGEPLTTRSPDGNEGGNLTGAAPPSQDTNGEPLTTRSPDGNEGGNVTGGTVHVGSSSLTLIMMATTVFTVFS